MVRAKNGTNLLRNENLFLSGAACQQTRLQAGQNVRKRHIHKGGIQFVISIKESLWRTLFQFTERDSDSPMTELRQGRVHGQDKLIARPRRIEQVGTKRLG